MAGRWAGRTGPGFGRSELEVVVVREFARFRSIGALVCLVVVGAACSSASPSSPPAPSSNVSGPALTASPVPSASPSPAPKYALSVLEATPTFSDIPLHAMVDGGYAAENNLTLSFATTISGGSANQLFAGGAADILSAGLDSPAKLVQTGAVPVTVIGVLDRTNVWVLVSKGGSKYKTLKDLTGQNVGISGFGGLSDFGLEYELKQAGMDPKKDVTLVALGAPASQYAALVSGTAVAVQIQSPIVDQGLRDGSLQIVDDMRKQAIASNVFSVRTADLTKNPAPYISFIKAYRLATDRLKNDPGWALQEAVKYYGITGTASDLQAQLSSFITGVWSLDCSFTQQLYDSSKVIIAGSGLIDPTTYPTYAQLTVSMPIVP